MRNMHLLHFFLFLFFFENQKKQSNENLCWKIISTELVFFFLHSWNLLITIQIGEMFPSCMNVPFPFLLNLLVLLFRFSFFFFHKNFIKKKIFFVLPKITSNFFFFRQKSFFIKTLFIVKYDLRKWFRQKFILGKFFLKFQSKFHDDFLVGNEIHFQNFNQNLVVFFFWLEMYIINWIMIIWLIDCLIDLLISWKKWNLFWTFFNQISIQIRFLSIKINCLFGLSIN